MRNDCVLPSTVGMSTLTLQRSQTFRNPDEDFVLQGYRSSYSEKPDYLRNSQITNTSVLLSQHTKFDPDKYRDTVYRKSLGNLADSLKKTSKDVTNTLTRSVTFNNYVEKKPSEEQILRNERFHESELPSAKYSQLSPRRSRSRTREDKDYSNQELEDFPIASYESLAKKYFPITFSMSFELEKVPKGLTQSQSISPQTAGKIHAMSRSKSALARLRHSADDKKYQRFKQMNYTFPSSTDVDKMYTMISEAPIIANATKVSSSPYQTNLADLRRERLRLEQERLLELKKLEEIEKLRPPRDKWYESTGTDFHYECHKNTELEKTGQRWKDSLSKMERSQTLIKSLANVCL